MFVHRICVCLNLLLTRLKLGCKFIVGFLRLKAVLSWKILLMNAPILEFILEQALLLLASRFRCEVAIQSQILKHLIEHFWISVQNEVALSCITKGWNKLGILRFCKQVAMHVKMSLLHLNVNDVEFSLLPCARRVQRRRRRVYRMLKGENREVFTRKSQLSWTHISFLCQTTFTGRRCGCRSGYRWYCGFPAARWL
jgi:hypothetical protein